jgi:glycosyltransferase involved in cell wall biosynthesis
MSDPRIQVSVVIPTYRRPLLVKRALRSALGQSFGAIEVIVVTDGPDPELAAELEAIGDRRLHIIQLSENRGANAARNAGVAAAHAPWVALLDDDDQWLPDKLDTQLRQAEHSRFLFPVVSCHTVLRTHRADTVLPRRAPDSGEHVSDYLFSRRGLFHGEGLIQTSTIFAPRELFLRVPFDQRLPALHETDWLLRALASPGAGLELCPGRLAIWHADENRPRITANGKSQKTLLRSAPRDWALRWARDNRALFTREAYASFVAGPLSYMFASRGSWRHSPPLFWEIARHGRPQAKDLLTFGMVWLVPLQARRWVREAVLSRRQGTARRLQPRGAILEQRDVGVTG